MKKKHILLLWAVYLVTGGYHITAHTLGLNRARYFKEVVIANSAAHAANQVMCYYKTPNRRGIYVESVKRIK